MERIACVFQRQAFRSTRSVAVSQACSDTTRCRLPPRLISIDISGKKFQTDIMECLRRPVAKRDHVPFAVDARHVGFPFFDLYQIKIHGEGQIAFATAQVDDIERPLLRQQRIHVVKNF